MDDAKGTLQAGEQKRYVRQIILPQLGKVGQKKIRNAKILVVGAGGLGSPAIQYLAGAGVGTLGIIDDDLVDESNLHRQVLHGMHVRGLPKVDSAAKRVEELTGGFVRVNTMSFRLNARNAEDIIRDYDVVIDGADNFPTRYLISDTCAKLSKPVVWGSVLGFDAQVSVFWAGNGPTLRDVFPTPPPAGSVPTCGEAGVMGALCGQAGSTMAMEAIKIVTGIGTPLVGRILVIDSLNARFSEIPLHSSGIQPDTATFIEIPVSELLREPPEATYIDVREPDEYSHGHIPGALLFPVGKIGQMVDKLPEGDLLIYCHAGFKAQEAGAIIASSGRHDFALVEGSFQAWQREGAPINTGMEA